MTDEPLYSVLDLDRKLDPGLLDFPDAPLSDRPGVIRIEEAYVAPPSAYMRRKHKRHTGQLVPATTHGGLRLSDSHPGETYVLRLPASHRSYVSQLDNMEDSWPWATLHVASLGWWWYVLHDEWESKFKGKAKRPSMTEYAFDQSREGGKLCGPTHGHCRYCDHALAMGLVGRFMLNPDGRLSLPRTHIWFRPSDDCSPFALRERVSELLTTYVAIRPRVKLRSALLVPSTSSRRADLDGKLHLHVALDATVPFSVLAAMGSYFGVEYGGASLRRPAIPPQDWLNGGWVLAYILQQSDSLDSSFDGKKERGGTTWKRWPTKIARARKRPNFDTVRSSVIAAVEAARPINRNTDSSEPREQVSDYEKAHRGE